MGLCIKSLLIATVFSYTLGEPENEQRDQWGEGSALGQERRPAPIGGTTGPCPGGQETPQQPMQQDDDQR